MLHAKVIINNKEYSCKIPQSWGETTFDQFYKLRDIDQNYSFADTVSILTGIQSEIFLDSDSIDFDDKIYPVLEWMNEDFKDSVSNLLVPDYVEINGKKIARPKGIALGSFGQKLAIQKIFTDAEKEGKDEVSCYAHALAIYLQPAYDEGKFNSDKAKELIPHILQMPLSQGWPLASFFLSNYEIYLRRRQTNFHKVLHRKRFLQELTTLKDSTSFQQLTLLRRSIIYLLTKFLSWSMLPSSLRSHTIKKKQPFNGTYTIK